MNAPIAIASSLLATGSLACGVFFFTSSDHMPTRPGSRWLARPNWVARNAPNAATVIQDHTKARTGRRAVAC